MKIIERNRQGYIDMITKFIHNLKSLPSTFVAAKNATKNYELSYKFLYFIILSNTILLNKRNFSLKYIWTLVENKSQKIFKL